MLFRSADPLKARARSQVTAMGRLMSKHLDTLIKLQGRRLGATVQVEDPIPIAVAEPPPLHSAPDEEAPNLAEPHEISAAEALSDVAPAPAPAPADHPYPGREKMLAARPSGLSRRKKTRLANKLMNVLRAAQ